MTYSNGMTYEEGMTLQYKVLDSLPLPKPECGMSLGDYETLIKEKFKNVELPKEMEGELFNYFDEYDIGEYLRKRFGARICEETRYYIVI